MSDLVKVIEKALDLLELLSGSQEFMSAHEISQEIGLPKSTVHRLLNTLVARGYVRKDENTFSYGIGLKVLQLKDLTRDHINLTNIARPILRDLATLTNCTAHLAILSQDSANYIDHWMSPSGIAIRTRLGEHAPLYCTSLGKVLLAWLPEDDLQDMIASIKFESHAPNTITDPTRFLQELENVRKQGFAEDCEESTVGIHCIGAPIRGPEGGVVAAISITTLAALVDETTRLKLIPLVRQHADNLSAQMGYAGAKVP
jgi:DNA-binding IclR family transcriptional regulator